MKADQRKRTLTAVTLFLLLLLAACGPKAARTSLPAAAPTEPVFLGYLPAGAVDVPAIDFSLYTHLCHAFILSDNEGNLLDTPGIPDRELTRAAHEAGVKVILSLGGWGSDEAFAALTADPSSRQRYIDAVMDLVDRHDYDGVDLDWEYPDTEEEVTAFNQLARTFRSRLDELGRRKGRPHLQTIAVSANDATGRWLDKAVLLQTMDFINVMTYDFAGPWTDFAGHHAAFRPSSKDPRDQAYSVQTSMEYWRDEKQMPADRLVVGIPLYGRGFPVSEPWEPVLSENTHESNPYLGIGYWKIAALLANGWTARMDSETGVPWATAPDSSAVIGYEDEDSVAGKVGWAMESGFRGIFFWHIGHDRFEDGSTPVQRKAREEWTRFTTE